MSTHDSGWVPSPPASDFETVDVSLPKEEEEEEEEPLHIGFGTDLAQYVYQ